MAQQKTPHTVIMRCNLHIKKSCLQFPNVEQGHRHLYTRITQYWPLIKKGVGSCASQGAFRPCRVFGPLNGRLAYQC